MSEKLRPNFTPVPNVIFDEAMRDLNEGEFKTLMAICRYTYGWGKQSDRISLNQLAEITGMNRSNVARARKRLGSLVDVTPGTATTASTYRLNIEISDAELKAATIKGSDPSATSDRSATSVKGSDPSATVQRKPKKEEYTGAKAPDSRSTKEKRKPNRPAPTIPPDLQPIVSRVVAKINELSGKGYRDDKPDPLKPLVDRLKAGATEVECLAIVEDKWLDWGKSEKMFRRFNPATLFRKGKFDEYLTEAQAANARNNGNGRPPQVKEIGNGMVEVDGRQMDRRPYERRHGQHANA